MLNWPLLVTILTTRALSRQHEQHLKLPAADSHSSSEGSFVWLSDIHLDFLYDIDSTQRTYCRPSTENTSYIANLCQTLTDIFEVTDPWPTNISAPPFTQLASSDPKDHKVALLPAYHGRYGCDTPLSLYWSTLLSIRRHLKAHYTNVHRPMDFFLLTGDFAAHYWTDSSRCLRPLSLIATTRILEKAMLINDEFPQVPPTTLEDWHHVRDLNASEGSYVKQFVFCSGNNDLEADYVNAENSTWNARLFDLWSPLSVPRSEEPTFVRGLYYTVPLQSDPKVRIICLNTAAWTDTLNVSAEADPLGQFEWLENQLRRANETEEEILIVGHIPPTHSLFRNGVGGFSVEKQWHDVHNKKYRQLVQTYTKLIKGQYFGHLHSDEFRLQTASSESNAVDPEEVTGLVLISPGLCTNHGANPSWRLARYSVNHRGYVLKKYRQYYTSLYGYDSPKMDLGTFDEKKLLEFRQEYDSSEAFGVTELTGRSMNKHYWRKMIESDQAIRDYWDLSLAQGGRPPAFLMRCVLLDSVDVLGVRACLEKHWRKALIEEVECGSECKSESAQLAREEEDWRVYDELQKEKKEVYEEIHGIPITE